MRRSLVRGVTIRSNASRSSASQVDYFADINIDATGRSRVLARRFDAKARRRRKPSLVAFKAHLQNARVAAGACEIYFYPGGYGGLNAIEGGRSNLCFIVAARDARRFQSDPERLMRELVCKNARAAQTLEGAETASPWLSVALEGFGRRKLIPAAGLLTAGDAASFIDPFTGSGMLMALESGELAAEAIILHQNKPAEDQTFSLLATEYRTAYAKKFSSRLRTAGFLRRAAFIPQLAEAAILFFGSDWLRQRMARATRAGSNRAAEGAADQKLTI
jgi:flavin-dependent dehydrogenase